MTDVHWVGSGKSVMPKESNHHHQRRWDWTGWKFHDDFLWAPRFLERSFLLLPGRIVPLDGDLPTLWLVDYVLCSLVCLCTLLGCCFRNRKRVRIPVTACLTFVHSSCATLFGVLICTLFYGDSGTSTRECLLNKVVAVSAADVVAIRPIIIILASSANLFRI